MGKKIKKITQKETKICEECGGAGKVIVGENIVTLDMAIDAGDRSMEGMHHSWEYEECPKCEGTGLLTKNSEGKI